MGIKIKRGLTLESSPSIPPAPNLIPRVIPKLKPIQPLRHQFQSKLTCLLKGNWGLMGDGHTNIEETREKWWQCRGFLLEKGNDHGHGISVAIFVQVAGFIGDRKSVV